MPDPTKDETTPPATGDQGTTTDDTITVPEGAENPDAVKALIKAERDAAKVAKREADEARSQVEALTERIATVEATAQDAQTKLADAQAALAPLQATVDRYEVALDKSLPKALVDRLKGDTKDALSADADALLALLPKAGTEGAVDFDAGVRPPAPPAVKPEEAHQALIRDLFAGKTPQT